MLYAKSLMREYLQNGLIEAAVAIIIAGSA
jgi:hypothetical protein